MAISLMDTHALSSLAVFDLCYGDLAAVDSAIQILMAVYRHPEWAQWWGMALWGMVSAADDAETTEEINELIRVMATASSEVARND